MNNKFSVAVAVLAGLAGGMLTRYIAPPTVFAQAQITPAPVAPAQNPQTQNAAPSVTREIRAQSFTLVDQYGNVAGTFTAEPTGPVRMFIPNDGAGAPQVQRSPMSIVLRDGNGHELWRAGAGLRLLAASPR